MVTVAYYNFLSAIVVVPTQPVHNRECVHYARCLQAPTPIVPEMILYKAFIQHTLRHL